MLQAHSKYVDNLRLRNYTHMYDIHGIYGIFSISYKKVKKLDTIVHSYLFCICALVLNCSKATDSRESF
jgi:sensor histidine kinase regulating citrate/malate metabolism